MITKQQNLKPFERTLAASGLLGLSDRHDLPNGVYPDTGFGWPVVITEPSQPCDRCSVLATGSAAGSPGLFGQPADESGNTPLS